MPKQQMVSTRTFKTTSEIEANEKKPVDKTKPIYSGGYRLKSNRLPWIIILILILFSIFMYTQYLSAKHSVQNTAASVNKQISDTISSVSKLAVVPINETPTVATVHNVDKLKNLSFYSKAQKGDEVIIYTKTGEAILYRPSTNKIVNILYGVSTTK
jgi:hypothetical protein